MSNEPGGDTNERLAEVLAAMRSANHEQEAADLADEKARGVLPGKGELVKAAPALAIICGTIIFVSILIVFGTLVIFGKPTDELFRLTNLFLNAVGATGVLTMLIVAVRQAERSRSNRAAINRTAHEVHRAAENAQQAAVAVNGGLEERMQRIAAAAAVAAVRQLLRDEPRKNPPRI